jgi:DNA mismatch repair protein MutS
VQGAASHSYGIHVARLAGLPATVISRAKEILSQLEGDQGARENLGRATRGLEREAPVQMALFESADRKLLEMLKTIDVANLTPIEALNLLYKICEEAQK